MFTEYWNWPHEGVTVLFVQQGPVCCRAWPSSLLYFINHVTVPFNIHIIPRLGQLPTMVLVWCLLLSWVQPAELMMMFGAFIVKIHLSPTSCFSLTGTLPARVTSSQTVQAVMRHSPVKQTRGSVKTRTAALSVVPALRPPQPRKMESSATAATVSSLATMR